jgi:hypothetical protein
VPITSIPRKRGQNIYGIFYIGFLFAKYLHRSISPHMEKDRLEHVEAKRAIGLFVLFIRLLPARKIYKSTSNSVLAKKATNNCYNTYYPKIFFLDICSVLGALTGTLNQCFLTAGPWRQLYRAARSSPGICRFSFLSIFHK